MTFREFVLLLVKVFNDIIIPLLVAIAFFIFLWGTFQYFFIKREDPTARKEGGQFMLWGIISFAVVVSMWGLVSILLKSFGLT